MNRASRRNTRLYGKGHVAQRNAFGGADGRELQPIKKRSLHDAGLRFLYCLGQGDQLDSGLLIAMMK
jgi:hypothetical protein